MYFLFCAMVVLCLKESTGSPTYQQRKSMGPIAFNSMDPSGGYIIIENSSSGTHARSQRLKGWRVVKTVKDDDYDRKSVNVGLNDYDLAPGEIFTVFARDAYSPALKLKVNEQMAGSYRNFGLGACVWTLLDEAGKEKATMTTVNI